MKILRAPLQKGRMETKDGRGQEGERPIPKSDWPDNAITDSFWSLVENWIFGSFRRSTMYNPLPTSFRVKSWGDTVGMRGYPPTPPPPPHLNCPCFPEHSVEHSQLSNRKMKCLAVKYCNINNTKKGGRGSFDFETWNISALILTCATRQHNMHASLFQNPKRHLLGGSESILIIIRKQNNVGQNALLVKE